MLIPQTVLNNVLRAGWDQGADFCEIYAEEALLQSMSLKSSQTEYLSSKDCGVGIRLLYGAKELYTHTNSFDEPSLMKALKSLAPLKEQIDKGKKSLQKPPAPYIDQKSYKKIADLHKEKLFLEKIDQALRGQNSSITQVHLSLIRKRKMVQIANSEGLSAFDIRPYFRFNSFVVAEGAGQKEIGYSNYGKSLDFFWNEALLKETAEKALKEALQNLKAGPAPAGRFPVIINKGFGGVIFHEACGHGMETTSVAENLSVFAGRLGKKIASTCVTAYDNGLMEGEYGSIAKDDEGHASQKTCLIEKGILKNYMADRLGAKKISRKMTGSSRRESYKYPPTSRMRNTYISAGQSSLEEMIGDIDCGLFAESMGGGSVAPGTGNYNFAVKRARLIKNGRLDRPVKGASLIGNGLDTLLKIKKVGRDLELAPGMCGSVSGRVPVTVGQPPILVSELTVGGTA